MAINLRKLRRWIKAITTQYLVPAIAPSNDHTDGSWSENHLYDREMAINTTDKKCWIRMGNEIVEMLGRTAAIDLFYAIRLGVFYFWRNATDRTNQTGMTEGQKGLQGDTRIVYKYESGAWVEYYSLDAIVSQPDISISHTWNSQAEQDAQTGMLAGALGRRLDTNNVYRWSGTSWEFWFRYDALAEIFIVSSSKWVQKNQPTTNILTLSPLESWTYYLTDNTEALYGVDRSGWQPGQVITISFKSGTVIEHNYPVTETDIIPLDISSNAPFTTDSDYTLWFEFIDTTGDGFPDILREIGRTTKQEQAFRNEYVAVLKNAYCDVVGGSGTLNPVDAIDMTGWSVECLGNECSVEINATNDGIDISKIAGTGQIYKVITKNALGETQHEIALCEAPREISTGNAYTDAKKRVCVITGGVWEISGNTDIAKQSEYFACHQNGYTRLEDNTNTYIADIPFDNTKTKIYEGFTDALENISFVQELDTGLRLMDLQWVDSGNVLYAITLTDIYRYEAGTAYDLSTLGTPTNFSLATEDSLHRSLHVKEDESMFFTGGDTNSKVYKYVMSTPGLLSSTTKTDELLISAAAFSGLTIRESDGLKLYIGDSVADLIREYDLLSAWTLTSGTQNSYYDLTTNGITDSSGIRISQNGDRLYIVRITANIHSFHFSTPWDISSIYETYIKSGIADTDRRGLFFTDDYTKMFFTDDLLDRLKEYSMFNEGYFIFDAIETNLNILQKGSNRGNLLKGDINDVELNPINDPEITAKVSNTEINFSEIESEGGSNPDFSFEYEDVENDNIVLCETVVESGVTKTSKID